MGNSFSQAKIPVYIENGHNKTWFDGPDTKSYKLVTHLDRDANTDVDSIIVKLDQALKQLPEIQKVINDPMWNMSIMMKTSSLGIENQFFTMDWTTKKFELARSPGSDSINIYIQGKHSEYGNSVNPFDKHPEQMRRSLEYFNKQKIEHAIAEKRIQDTIARL